MPMFPPGCLHMPLAEVNSSAGCYPLLLPVPPVQLGQAAPLAQVPALS